MLALFASIGVIFLLIGIATSFIVLVTLLLPSSKNIIPDDWQRWLSFNYVTYYWLIGGSFLLISQEFQ